MSTAAQPSPSTYHECPVGSEVTIERSRSCALFLVVERRLGVARHASVGQLKRAQHTTRPASDAAANFARADARSHAALFAVVIAFHPVAKVSVPPRRAVRRRRPKRPDCGIELGDGTTGRTGETLPACRARSLLSPSALSGPRRAESRVLYYSPIPRPLEPSYLCFAFGCQLLLRRSAQFPAQQRLDLVSVVRGVAITAATLCPRVDFATPTTRLPGPVHASSAATVLPVGRSTSREYRRC